MWACNVEHKLRDWRLSVVCYLKLILYNNFCGFSISHHVVLGEHASSAHQQQQQNVWTKQCIHVLCLMYCLPVLLSVFHLHLQWKILLSLWVCFLPPPRTLQVSLITCLKRGCSNVCVSNGITPGTCQWIRDSDSFRNVAFFLKKWKHVYLSRAVHSNWWCCNVNSEPKRLLPYLM